MTPVAPFSTPTLKGGKGEHKSREEKTLNTVPAKQLIHTKTLFALEANEQQQETRPSILCVTLLVGTESVQGLYACIYWKKWRFGQVTPMPDSLTDNRI